MSDLQTNQPENSAEHIAPPPETLRSFTPLELARTSPEAAQGYVEKRVTDTIVEGRDYTQLEGVDETARARADAFEKKIRGIEHLAVDEIESVKQAKGDDEYAEVQEGEYTLEDDETPPGTLRSEQLPPPETVSKPVIAPISTDMPLTAAEAKAALETFPDLPSSMPEPPTLEMAAPTKPDSAPDTTVPSTTLEAKTAGPDTLATPDTTDMPTLVRPDAKGPDTIVNPPSMDAATLRGPDTTSPDTSVSAPPVDSSIPVSLDSSAFSLINSSVDSSVDSAVPTIDTSAPSSSIDSVAPTVNPSSEPMYGPEQAEHGPEEAMYGPKTFDEAEKDWKTWAGERIANDPDREFMDALLDKIQQQSALNIEGAQEELRKLNTMPEALRDARWQAAVKELGYAQKIEQESVPLAKEELELKFIQKEHENIWSKMAAAEGEIAKLSRMQKESLVPGGPAMKPQESARLVELQEKYKILTEEEADVQDKFLLKQSKVNDIKDNITMFVKMIERSRGIKEQGKKVEADESPEKKMGMAFSSGGAPTEKFKYLDIFNKGVDILFLPFERYAQATLDPDKSTTETIAFLADLGRRAGTSKTKEQMEKEKREQDAKKAL